MKRTFSCESSKRPLGTKKEKQLSELLSETKRLNQLWTPTLLAPPTDLLEAPLRADESNESDCQSDREMSLQGTLIDNYYATFKISTINIMDKERVSSEVISYNLATGPPNS